MSTSFMDPSRDRAGDLLRSLGALLLASGVVALEIRKATTWGLGARMVVVLIPALLFYALALAGPGGPRRGPRGDAEPWQSVLAVFAVVLNLIWLTLFFRWIGAKGSLVTIPACVLTAASAAFAAWQANVLYAALLAALDLVVGWLALWNKILGHPSGSTDRWLLVIIGAALVAGAAGLARLGRRESSELVTAAGVAGVLAASAGVFNDLAGFSLNRVVRAVGLAHSVGGFNVRQRFLWDLVLLLISVGMIAYASRARVRGPGYVGAVGLFVFLFSVGLQISTRLSGHPVHGDVLGWPLALLLVGAAALLLGFFGRFTPARGGARPPGAVSVGADPPPAG